MLYQGLNPYALGVNSQKLNIGEFNKKEQDYIIKTSFEKNEYMMNLVSFRSIIEGARQNINVIDIYEACVFDGNQCISPDVAVNFIKLILVQRAPTDADLARSNQVLLPIETAKELGELKEKNNYLKNKLIHAVQLLQKNNIEFTVDVRYLPH